MKFNNKTYDIAKYVCLIGLPAVATFIAAFGAIWGLSHTDEIVKTVIAVNVLASSLIVIKGVQYNNSDARFDGVALVTNTPPGQPDVLTNVVTKDTIDKSTENGQLNLRVVRQAPEAA